MFETMVAASLAAPAAYRGPERRSNPSPGLRHLSMMLDEIDYGMLLLNEEAVVLHANHAARAELDATHPLQVLGRQLRARHAIDVARLHDALAAASLRGLRRLVQLGEGDGRVTLSVVPLPDGHTLVVLGKRRLSERLSVQCFARAHGLTPAETRVLELLCENHTPREIAELNGVGLATVRTQIGSIRAKTGAATIRELVRQVAVLPPIVSAIKN